MEQELTEGDSDHTSLSEQLGELKIKLSTLTAETRKVSLCISIFMCLAISAVVFGVRISMILRSDHRVTSDHPFVVNSSVLTMLPGQFQRKKNGLKVAKFTT